VRKIVSSLALASRDVTPDRTSMWDAMYRLPALEILKTGCHHGVHEGGRVSISHNEKSFEIESMHDLRPRSHFTNLSHAEAMLLKV
jgi:hypothetical protein